MIELKMEFVEMANKHNMSIMNAERKKAKANVEREIVEIASMIVIMIICMIALFKISNVTTERLEKAYGNMSYTECVAAYNDYYINSSK